MQIYFLGCINLETRFARIKSRGVQKNKGKNHVLCAPLADCSRNMVVLHDTSYKTRTFAHLCCIAHKAKQKL